MEIKNSIKKAFLSACVYFTLIVTALMLCRQFMNFDGTVAAIDASQIILIFIFSLLVSIGNFIRYLKSINRVAGALLRFVITVCAFYACFLLPAEMQTSFAFTGTVIFALAYAAVLGIIALFKSRLSANRENLQRHEQNFSSTPSSSKGKKKK